MHLYVFLAYLGLLTDSKVIRNQQFRIRREKDKERNLSYKIKQINIGERELNRKVRKIAKELLEKNKIIA